VPYAIADSASTVAGKIATAITGLAPTVLQIKGTASLGSAILTLQHEVDTSRGNVSQNQTPAYGLVVLRDGGGRRRGLHDRDRVPDQRGLRHRRAADV